MEEILKRFKITGIFEHVSPFGSGHIKDTFRAVNKNEKGKDYLLQKINHKIFKEVGMMMDNIARVTAHIRAKLDQNPNFSERYDTLTIVPTVKGQLYFQDANGDYWRVLEFLKGLKSYDFVETPDQAYQGQVHLGNFWFFWTTFQSLPSKKQFRLFMTL